MKRFLFVVLSLMLILTYCILPSSIVCVANAASTTVSVAPNADDITVTNNTKGTYDTVYVSGLSAKDIVKAYNASSDGKLLGRATASSAGVATVKISQLGTNAGSVYVSVTNSGCAESDRVEVAYDAEPVSDALNADDITVTNNAKGTYDTVYVSGLSAKDIVKAYNASSDGKLLGRATASSAGVATIKIAQLGSVEGSIYISLTSSGCLESSRVEVTYDAELVSDAPAADDITVTNNAKGTSDTVYVQNLSAGDIVKVYNKETSGTLRGSKTVASSGNDATVTIAQLGTDAGTVYVSVKSTSMNESDRVAVDYAEEEASTAPSESNITVTNNPAGASDKVYVKGLSASDVVKVYNAAASGKLLGKATAASTDATVTITQLGTDAASVYVSVTSTGKKESGRTAAEYNAEAASDAPDSSNITITNNASGASDTVYVDGLQGNDVVKVYKSSTGGTAIGTGTVASGKTNVTISISQLGTSAGSVYITVTSTDKSESSCTKADYGAEETSTAPDSGNITVANNLTGTSDTVYVKGLSSNDIITVYDAATNGDTLGTATVSSSENSATVTISQLGTGSGSVYVSVTSTGKKESSRTAVEYDTEATSNAPDSSNITITNNAAGTSDTVFVTGVSSGDVVNVYAKASGGTVLGTATVADGTTYATVTISQLGTGSGSVYVSVTSTKCLESERAQASYAAESQTAALSAGSVSVTNNSGTSDTVKVTGLTSGDIVKIYDAATSGTLLGTATVSTYGSSATVTIEQLGAAGSVYVTLTGKNKTESARTEVTYSAEAITTAPKADNVTITNNASISDTIVITGLSSGDAVTVYEAAVGDTTLGIGTVASASSTVTITIKQLGSSAGSVYISATSTNKAESDRTEVAYDAEEQTDAPDADNITVVNKYLSASTVTITDLVEDDIVNIYNAASGGTLLGTGTVGTYDTEVTVSISQLSTSGGYVYITVTSNGKTESKRTAFAYSAVSSSAAPEVSDVTVVNNADISDTITVKNVSTGTVVKVYDAGTGGELLGTATATGTKVVVTIDQLGADAGTVYISAIRSGKVESSRTAVPYDAEAASDVILSGNVTIVNNSGLADTITITGLADGDVINVYKASSGGTAIAAATAAESGLTTTLTVSQLGTTAGSVYISVTCEGYSESSRTEVKYAAESTAPAASSITIVNNAGISDTITVTGLTSGDMVNVYNAATSGTLLGSATVSSDSTTAEVSVSQLSSAAGYAYISVTNSGRAESSLTKVSYIAEQTTDAPDEGDIYIVNNSSIADTITVYNLVAGDVIRVYDATDGELLGRATAASGATEATVSIDELGTSSGSVYVTVKSKGKLESGATEASYSAESKSTAPYAGNITINNNVSIADTVVVSGLGATDVVKVYNASASGTLLGYATVTSGSSSVSISISQLGTGAGTVYVSVTEVGKTESDRTAADYVSETTSNEAHVGNITIVNNPVGTSDTITITGLTSGDLIQVYDAATEGNLLGSATVSSSGTSATVTISQLGITAGSVYITVTSTGKSESARTKVSYISE